MRRLTHINRWIKHSPSTRNLWRMKTLIILTLAIMVFLPNTEDLFPTQHPLPGALWKVFLVTLMNLVAHIIRVELFPQLLLMKCYREALAGGVAENIRFGCFFLGVTVWHLGWTIGGTLGL